MMIIFSSSRLYMLFIGFINICFILSHPAFAQNYQTQDSTYHLLFGNSGSSYSDGSTRSQDQTGNYILIGDFEAYDVGYNNTDGATYKFKSGLQPTFEANVSTVNILSALDGVVELSDSLLFQINPNGNPTSADGVRFAVQIDSDLSFTSPKYVNPTTFTPDNITNPNLYFYYQPCAQTSHLPADKTRWDCGTVPGLKKYIRGLNQNTQYCVRVIALNGDATNSEPGPGVCATTYSQNLTFTVSQESSNFGVLSTTTVNTATPPTILTSSTNTFNGYTVKVVGKGNGTGHISGLYSENTSSIILSTSGNLDTIIGNEGYGLQTAILSGAGEINLDGAFNPNLAGRNSSYVGQILRTTTNLYSTSSPNTTTHRVSVTYKATISTSTLAANDYTDVLTYTMIPN